MEPDRDARLHVWIMMDRPKCAGGKEERAEKYDVEPARRHEEHRRKRRQQQRGHAEIALHDQDRHRGSPPDKKRPEILYVCSQRPRACLRNDVGHLRKIGGQEEHDAEFDQLDRLVFDRTDLDPETRAVDLLAEEKEHDEERQRRDDPQILDRRQAAELGKAGPQGQCQPEREQQPQLLAMRQRPARAARPLPNPARPKRRRAPVRRHRAPSWPVARVPKPSQVRPAQGASMAAQSRRAAQTRASTPQPPTRPPSALVAERLGRSVRENRRDDESACRGDAHESPADSRNAATRPPRRLGDRRRRIIFKACDEDLLAELAGLERSNSVRRSLSHASAGRAVRSHRQARASHW